MLNPANPPPDSREHAMTKPKPAPILPADSLDDLRERLRRFAAEREKIGLNAFKYPVQRGL